jgi:osmoprotectant transport system substrate-binding protein
LITTRKRSLLAAAAAVALVLAACGEEGSSADDDDDAADGGGEEAGVVFEFVPLDVGGPLTKEALESGQIDIGLLFSSDGAIAANEWVALEDDQNLQPADNFVPAIRVDAVTPEIETVLNAVSSSLTVEDMQAMVASVAIEGENPADVAREFLNGLGLPSIAVSGSITAGSADFAESEIAMELYAGALETAGMTVERTSGIGSREVYIPALESGEIDLIPEFIGTLLVFLDPEAAASPDPEQTAADARALAEARGFTLLEPAEADSVNTFVVTQETADEFDLASISDLANVDEPLALGGPPECPERDFCLLGLQDTYGLEFNV